MAQAAKTFQCTIVAPQGRVLDCRASSVIIPAYDGQRGILPGHAPIFFQLGLGRMTVKCPPAAENRPATELFLLIDGGFAMFNSNNLAVTASEGFAVRDMPVERLEQLIEKCQAAISSALAGSAQQRREQQRLKLLQSFKPEPEN